MLNAMLPGSESVEDAIRNRLAELHTFGAAAARPLVEEEEVLARTRAWYSARNVQDPLIGEVDRRLSVVREELDHVLPLWEEAQLLDRVVRLYERVRSGEQDPGRFRILRNQIRHRIELERRNAGQGPPTKDTVMWAPHARPAALPPRPADEPVVEDADSEAAVASSARSRAVQEQVGRFAREFLDVTRADEVTIGSLFEAISDYATRQWPNSTMRARLENFRYALRRAAPHFGLIYDQGRVRRDLSSERG